MSSCPRTKNYVSKRTTEGKNKREIMRRLKRYVSREIYRQIFNPVPAPDITDLRQKRKSLRLTVNAVAGELSQWPSIISRLERGILRNDDLAASYRKWLEEQAAEKTN